MPYRMQPGAAHRNNGTQLTGFVTVGEDDYQVPQNFPIVYLKDSAGNVHYARSANFSTMAPSTPGEVESADSTLLCGLAHGMYSRYVSACGTSSGTGFSSPSNTCVGPWRWP
jgi:hypothetical protein